MTKPYKCRVEYLESTGTQWIDTGLNGNLNTKIEARVYSKKLGSDSGYCIAGDFTTSTKAITMPFNFSSAGLYSRFGDKAITGGIQQADGTYTFAIDKVGYYVDGTKIADLNTTTDFTTSGTMMLFGFTGLGRNYLIGKMYYCKIWDGDTLVCDFVPVLDNSGKPAMYDQVSGKLFYNQGTGEFTYGRQIIPVEYLESTGTQYIDTGLDASSSIIWDLDASFEDYDQSYQLNGCYVSSQRFMIGVNASNYYSLSYVGNNTTTVLNDNKRHSFQIDAPNKTWSIDGGTYSGSFSEDFTATSARLLLFARKTSSVDGFIRGRIYGSKFTNNGVLVRDYIPCIDENNTPFMFDKVNNTVYLNAGTGQFKIGPNVEKVWGGKKLRRKLALALANLKKKRRYYCEVEYLYTGDDINCMSSSPFTSTSYRLIDTNETIDLTSVVEIKFAFDKNIYYSGCGLRNSTSSTAQSIYFPAAYSTENKMGWTIGSGEEQRQKFTLDTNDHTIRVDLPNSNVVWDGINYPIANLTYTPSSRTFPLFAFSDVRATQENGYRFPMQGKIYYAKFWKNGVLTRDFIPVLDWNMTPCMYDKVTEQLFYNQGS